MLIKLRPDLYLNTNHISAICFFDNEADGGPCAIVESNGRPHQITQTAARGLLQFLDVNESIVFDEGLTTGAPDLKSQIAVMLRDTWKGASFEQLDAIFPGAGARNIADALHALEQENVILAIPRDGNELATALWYHRSSSEAQAYSRNLNAMHFSTNTSESPLCGFTANGLATTATLALVNCANCREELGLNVKPSPGLSVSDEALPDASDPVAADTDSIVDPKIES